MRKFVFSAALAAVAMVCAISVPAQGVKDMYMAGVSYSSGATPSIAGSALYAKAVSPDTAPGTYAFTAVDVLPNTVKPLTVTTNVAVGIAQKVATVGAVDILVPTSAGISLTGSNAGWAWSTGAGAVFHVKENFYAMPTVRVLKSSVSNGTGYQPILGVMFGWGK